MLLKLFPGRFKPCIELTELWHENLLKVIGLLEELCLDHGADGVAVVGSIHSNAAALAGVLSLKETLVGVGLLHGFAGELWIIKE